MDMAVARVVIRAADDALAVHRQLQRTLTGTLIIRRHEDSERLPFDFFGGRRIDIGN